MTYIFIIANEQKAANSFSLVELNNYKASLKLSLPVTHSIRKKLTQYEYPTPHFVPEGISSSLRDFIVLVFGIEVFQIKFSLLPLLLGQCRAGGSNQCHL